MKLLKSINYILVLLIVGSLSSCYNDNFDFEYDPSTVVPIIQGISGPADASANNVTEYEYSVSPRGGSSYTFSVEGATTLSITPDADRPHAANIIFAESPVDKDAFVIIVETAANGKSSAPDSVAVTVSAYCSYNAQDLVGTLPGTDERNGWIYDSQILVVGTGSDASFKASNFAKEWMGDYWGEAILASAEVDMELDPLGLFLTIPEQYIYTTDWNGDPYDYSIVGSGLVNACTGEITIEYDLINTTDGYDISGFVVTVGFP